MSSQFVEPYQYKNRFIEISSKDKSLSSSSSSNFTVQLPSEGGVIDGVCGVLVKSISIPNVFPNVQSWNNILIISDVALTHVITIPTGQYNITTFIAILTSTINTAIAPNTVVITQTSQGNLIFTFSAGTPYDFIYAQSTIRDLIGLTQDTTDASTPDVVTMPSIPNLIGITDVFVRSNQIFSGGQISQSGAAPVIQVVNMDNPYGTMCYGKFYDAVFNFIKYIPEQSPKSYRDVDITLTDLNGNILEWPNNQTNPNFYFTMILKIYYI